VIVGASRLGGAATILPKPKSTCLFASHLAALQLLYSISGRRTSSYLVLTPHSGGKGDPKLLREAQSRSDRPHWEKTMGREIDALEPAGTWETVLRPKDKNVVG
jgi:hypothetical protein